MDFELQDTISIFHSNNIYFTIHSFYVISTSTGLHTSEMSLLLLGIQGHKDSHAAHQSISWHGGHGAIQRGRTHVVAL